MKELIKIQTNEVGENCISARELHEGLKIKSKFNDWMTNRIKKYGFEEKIDFILVTKILETNNPKNPTTKEKDYIITVDMAKELCMVENSEIGRQFRKYFIECEKKLKQVTKEVKHYEKKKIFNDESPLLMEGKKSDTIYNNFKNNTVRKELERIINKTGIKVTNIAKAINISDSNMSDFRNNKINFNDEKLELIINILDSAKGLLLLL